MRSRFLRHLGAISQVSEGPAGAHLAHAATLAARGAPTEELPAEFSWHDYAIFLLSTAAEIEHSLMVQYLYAAYSLGGPQVPEEHRADVLRWQQIILGIAKEEMGHLVTVQNILTLLGGPLHLDREDYPWGSEFYPYRFMLEPLSKKSLAKYVVAESPEDWPKSVKHERDGIEELARDAAMQSVIPVHKLYDEMIKILSNPKHIPDLLFRAETYPLQASWDDWGRGYAKGARGAVANMAPEVLVKPAASRTEAVAALKAIAEQGEAVKQSADSTSSHFWRFLCVYHEFSKVIGWSPTLPLAENPRAPGLGAGDGGTVVEHLEASWWAGLFNLRYRMLLAYLAHAFRLSDDPAQNAMPARRGQVLNRVFGEMYNLKAIADILTGLPLKNDLKTRAGPPFEMPYSLSFPSSETAFWRLHFDLIEASKAQLARVKRCATTGLDYAKALWDADEQTRSEINVILQASRESSRFLRSAGGVS
jgi:hypothetical protein